MIESADLESLLESNDPEERRRATSELFVRASDAPLGTCSLVLKALADEDWRVRKEAIATAFALAPNEEMLAELVRALKPGDNVGLRNAAVEALGGFGVHAVSALDKALPGLDADGRKLAVEALGRVGHHTALGVLTRMLTDADPNVRVAAVEAMADLGRAGVLDAVKRLEQCVGSAESMLALAALNGLNALGVPLPFEKVARLLEEPMLRRPALLAAGRTRDPGAVEPVLGALERATGGAFVELVCAVAELAHQSELVPLLRAQGRGLSERANQKLSLLCADEAAFDDARRAAMVSAAALNIPGAAEHAVSALGDDRFIAEAHEMFELLGAAAVPTLALAVTERALPERASCLLLLGRLVPPQQIDLLLRTAVHALGDELPDVQREALAIIARLGDAELLSPLARSLPREAGAPTRTAHGAALIALSMRHPEEARKLVAAADPMGPSADPASLVITALAVRGAAEPPDHEFLAAAAGNASPAVRRSALEALAELGSDGALDALSFAVTDEEDDVCEAAVSALGRLRDSSKRAAGFERLREIVENTTDEKLRVRALKALGDTLDDRAIAALAPFVKGSPALIAIVAVEAISKLGGPVDALLDALAHPEPEVVKAGMLALSDQDDPRILPRLIQCLEHEAWDVRSLSAELLARVPGEDSKAALRARLASEPSTAVRESLTRSLERMSGVRLTPPPILGGSLPPR